MMTKAELLATLEQAEAEGWKELDLSGQGLHELPPEIGRLTKLEVLKLGQRKEKRGNVTVYWQNHLKDLPHEVTQLVNLTELDLSYNQLSELPESVTQLVNLTSLNLSFNQLSELPESVTQLVNLTELNLSSNQLSELPESVTQLVNLTSLDLSDNQLSELPESVTQLVNLTELDLSGNQLVTLPPVILNLPLRSLAIDENPFSKFPPEITEQGKSGILTYLRERLGESHPQWVSKLLVVGQGGVGKTCLLRALRGEAFQQQNTTHGIALDRLNLPHPTVADTTMQLNTWDFAGQEINHATHQFFLTNRSLFLLAWNARMGYEQSKLEYWLDTIQANAPDSPILLVATHTDQRDADLPLTDLKHKYKQIIGLWEVSNTSNKGIDDLRNAITTQAAQLPLMGEIWPATWLNAANEIRQLCEKHTTPQQLWQIMADQGVANISNRVLARWLHELGEILWFDDDAELDTTVILKPQWVTEYISKVLESPEVISRTGIFTRDHMHQLWGDLPRTMQDHFLSLMEKFDLSYKTLDNQEISLVVECLALDEAKYHDKWDAIAQQPHCREISMRFELNTIPAGIPTWFIARQHRFTSHIHWRLGALFEDAGKNHLALLKTFPYDRYVQLTVRGPHPHNFFALLRDGLELTIDRFPGLVETMKRKVPCPGHEAEQRCKHLFDYAHLEKAILQDPPIECLPCMESSAFEMMQVSELLYGINWNTKDKVLSQLEKLEKTVIIGNQDTLDNQVAILDNQDKMATNQSELLDQLSNLRELTQREFANSFRREQASIDARCPNVFFLKPVNQKTWRRNLVGDRIELQLCCQQPGCWHTLPDNAGTYTINDPAKWLKTMAPYIRHLVTVLKFAAPMFGPWLGLTFSQDDYEEFFQYRVELMKELADKLPELESSTPDSNFLEGPHKSRGLEIASGSALRSLRLFLDEADPQQHWGGLKHVLTPEGHHLWLCDHHAQQYQR